MSNDFRPTSGGHRVSSSLVWPCGIDLRVISLTALSLVSTQRNRLRWQAANHGCHCFDRASYWLQAAANRMLGRSSGNHDWLLANASAIV